MTIDRFFASPLVARIVLNVVFFLAITTVLTVGFAATHHATRTAIEPCAMVLTRESGPECR